ncbi:hypothetical protein Tco_0174247 [Tanacetum coccineum]
MADPNDDISVIKKIPAQPKADVSEPDVNGHVEPEVVMKPLMLIHMKTRGCDRELYQLFITAKENGIFCGPSADHCTSEMETVSSFVSAILTQSWFTSS